MLKVLIFQNPIILIALFVVAMFYLDSNPRLAVEILFAMFGYFYIMLSADNTFIENIGMLIITVAIIMYTIA